MAKWLFSQNFGEDGSPEGIGLSLWRVNLEGVYVSAYISPEGKKLAVVAGNIACAPENLKISMPESQAKKFAKVLIFQTNKSTNLAKIGQTSAFINNAPFRLPASPISTLLIESDE